MNPLCLKPATLTMCVLYLMNSFTLESVLRTLIPPCGALSLSCRCRCLRGVHVKERYAPERSSLVRIAFLRTIVGEEVRPSSGLLTWSVLACEITCSEKSRGSVQHSNWCKLSQKEYLRAIYKLHWQNLEVMLSIKKKIYIYNVWV